MISLVAVVTAKRLLQSSLCTISTKILFDTAIVPCELEIVSSFDWFHCFEQSPISMNSNLP